MNILTHCITYFVNKIIHPLVLHITCRTNSNFLYTCKCIYVKMHKLCSMNMCWYVRSRMCVYENAVARDTHTHTHTHTLIRL